MNFLVFVYVFYEIDVFYFIRKHVLLCLMSLEEFIVISLLFLIMYFLMFSYSLYLYIVFMTFFVCEGVLGLGVLVLLNHCHGNDNLSSFLW